MSEKKPDFTLEQAAAVAHRGSSLLVSAAAGSGKTKVLVERLISRVMQNDNINEFLIITYTRAAASELRERIYDEILERLSLEPENRKLRRQSMLCRGAPIGTIHSFCTDVLRENAHIAGLPPDFRVADESECDMIKAEVLDDVMNLAYERLSNSEFNESGGGGFLELVDAVSAGRDDKKLIRIILDVHTKLQSNPNPRAWALEQMERLSLLGISDVSETIWGAHLIEKARATATYWLEKMAELDAETKVIPDFEKAYGASIGATLEGLKAFVKALEISWDEAKNHCDIDFPGAKPVKGYEDLKDIRQSCKQAMKKNAETFMSSSSEHIEDIRAVAPAMTELFNLVLEFDSAYSAEKRRRGAVDFSDLEHLVLSILVNEETGEKTGLAREISRRFKEVLVDEYQDVNAVQELIFQSVSNEGNNIFMVGDVKQSIYRFRLADPSIFLDKYRSYSDINSEFGIRNSELGATGGKCPGGGSKIHLSTNFRSRAGILDAVNLVFGRIMSLKFGEMDYTEREKLIPGRKDENSEFGIRNSELIAACTPECAIPNSEFSCEFDIIDMSGISADEDEESPAKTQVEARFIAKRIAEITNGAFMIPDGNGGMRQVAHSDIVILLRSMRDKAWIYAAALQESGIPSDMPGGEGFFETLEISAALSLLEVIDNPMQDIPLASALSGPVYGFTADELASIRSDSKSTDFYAALKKAGEANESCSLFLKDINDLRSVMPDMPADRFIWYVYNKTRLLERVGVMSGGDRRRSNLILLAESARTFEQSGFKGLFGFLTYVRGLRDRGAELIQTSASAHNAGAADAVRIMSIHKSKGLEFPVVFLADTSKQFNYMDAQKPLVLHPEMGPGPMRTDRNRRIEYTTLMRMAIQSKLKSEMLAEELRVLYVAMTRAREKLIITAALKDADKEIEKMSKVGEIRNSEFGIRNSETRNEGKIAPQALEDIRSMAGWIIAAAYGSANSQFTIHDSKLDVGANCVRPQTTDTTAVGADVPGRPQAMKTDEPSPFLADPCLDEAIIPNSEFRIPNSHAYPYALAPDLPSKLTVTALKGIHMPSDAAIIPNSEFWIPNTNRPSFISSKTGLSAAERGTALHTALQHIDFQKCGNAEGIIAELERLTEKKLLTEEQAAVIDSKKILNFFESEIGRRMLKSNKVNREFKFSLLYPAESFYPGGGDDKILFQGVIDCFFEEDGELTVVDFKTDYVTPETLEEKANSYAPQLNAYADALRRITGKRVKQKVIYFFAIDEFCVS